LRFGYANAGDGDASADTGSGMPSTSSLIDGIEADLFFLVLPAVYNVVQSTSGVVPNLEDRRIREDRRARRDLLEKLGLTEDARPFLNKQGAVRVERTRPMQVEKKQRVLDVTMHGKRGCGCRRKGAMIVRRCRAEVALQTSCCVASATTEYYDPFSHISKHKDKKVQRCVVIMSNMPSYQVVIRYKRLLISPR
jgi:hypothetical protein